MLSFSGCGLIFYYLSCGSNGDCALLIDDNGDNDEDDGRGDDFMLFSMCSPMCW